MGIEGVPAVSGMNDACISDRTPAGLRKDSPFAATVGQQSEDLSATTAGFRSIHCKRA